jgi:uncharacterized protein
MQESEILSRSFLAKRPLDPASPLKSSAEIRDPIHGYIYADGLERAIIDTSTFQRLRRIRQLAGCFLVYPGGQHSRFEHAVGAMFLAGKAGTVLESRNYLSFSEENSLELRLAALLHDVGHGPFSHMFEEVMAEKTEFTHEDMTQRIIKRTEIGDILQRSSYDKNRLSDLAIGRSKGKNSFMNDVIGGGLSVDLMDYLPRDSYFTGVEYGKVDIARIINSLEVVGNKLAIDEAAKFAFEALIIARYEMFRAVYFHRAVRAAELMLIKSMLLSDRELGLTDLSLQNYLSLTDEITLNRIRQLKPNGTSDLKKAKLLAENYYSRKLLKCVFEQPVQRKNRLFSTNLAQTRFRDQLANEIAAMAGVDSDEIFVDVPTAPSVPLSSAKEALENVTLVKSRRREIGDRQKAYEMGIEKFPLVSAISGYLDVIRVYTSNERNEKLGKIAAKILVGQTKRKYTLQ